MADNPITVVPTPEVTVKEIEQKAGSDVSARIAKLNSVSKDDLKKLEDRLISLEKKVDTEFGLVKKYIESHVSKIWNEFKTCVRGHV